MADTQTAAEQVVQPIQQTLSALELARQADTRQPITLNAMQAYAELEQFGTDASQYTRGALEGQDYFMFKFRGAICTVTTDFKKAFDEGALLGLTATPTVFEQSRPDPNNAGKQMQVISLGWSLSFSDLSKLKKAQAAMSAASTVQFEIMKQEKVAAKKLELLEATDLSNLISEEEMKQLMFAAGA